MSTYEFHLFIAGRSPRSTRAVRNLERICRDELGDDAEIVVVDVLEDPEQAETRRILTTPTLIKQRPAPHRRVTGDLSDARRVLHALAVDGLRPEGTGT